MSEVIFNKLRIEDRKNNQLPQIGVLALHFPAALHVSDDSLCSIENLKIRIKFVGQTFLLFQILLVSDHVKGMMIAETYPFFYRFHQLDEPAEPIVIQMNENAYQFFIY